MDRARVPALSKTAFSSSRQKFTTEDAKSTEDNPEDVTAMTRSAQRFRPHVIKRGNVITAIARIILYVKDIPKVAHFYERHFGFKPIPSDEKGWLELAGAHSACLTEEGRRLIAREAH